MGLERAVLSGERLADGVIIVAEEKGTRVATLKRNGLLRVTARGKFELNGKPADEAAALAAGFPVADMVVALGGPLTDRDDIAVKRVVTPGDGLLSAIKALAVVVRKKSEARLAVACDATALFGSWLGAQVRAKFVRGSLGKW